MSLRVEYKKQGPLLTGQGSAIIDRHLMAIETGVADEGVRRVRQRLGQVLKHPTGFYESRVVKTTRSDGADITDGRVVYGPWLEGVSSRNTRSRFKGYHTFRLVGQQLDADAVRLAQPAVDAMVRDLNGN